MPRPILTVMVFIAAILAAPAALAAHRSFEKQFSAPSNGRLTVHTEVGSVRVLGSSTGKVTVSAQLTGTKSFLDRIHITARETAAGVTVSAHLARSHLDDWFHFAFFQKNDVRFTVEVPRDYPVDLQTSGGDISVRDLNAPVRAASSGGDISITGVAGKIRVHTAGGDARLLHVSGEVHVQTGGGDIQVKYLKGPATVRASGGDIQIENSNGALELHAGGGAIQVKNDTGPATLNSAGGDIHIADSTGTMDLRTGGGDIEMLNDAGKVQGLTGGGSVWARLRANDGIRFKSGGGNIDVLLPRNVGASLDASSGGGSVTCDFPFSAPRLKSGTRLAGTIGTGGARISLHASGGDIRIGPAR